jgi:hypothetical protein
MLHVGLDLSRRRLDVCLLDEAGELVAQTAAAPDADGLGHVAARLSGQSESVEGTEEFLSVVGDEFGEGGEAFAESVVVDVQRAARLVVEDDVVEVRQTRSVIGAVFKLSTKLSASALS